jgi:hypothetical protein
MGFKKGILLIFCLLLLSSYAYSNEVKFEYGRISMDLPKTWTYETVTQKTDTGDLIVQRWVREAIRYNNIDFHPGISARIIPLEEFKIKDADKQFVLLSGHVLGQSPYNITLSDIECLKCVKYEGTDEAGAYTAISNSIPPDCTKKSEQKPDSVCTYETLNKYGLNLEPSWMLRFQKDANGNKLNVDLIHLMKDNKLIEIAFWYPAALTETLEPEITEIIHTIKSY